MYGSVLPRSLETVLMDMLLLSSRDYPDRASDFMGGVTRLPCASSKLGLFDDLVRLAGAQLQHHARQCTAGHEEADDVTRQAGGI